MLFSRYPDCLFKCFTGTQFSVCHIMSIFTFTTRPEEARLTHSFRRADCLFCNQDLEEVHTKHFACRKYQAPSWPLIKSHVNSWKVQGVP